MRSELFAIVGATRMAVQNTAKARSEAEAARLAVRASVAESRAVRAASAARRAHLKTDSRTCWFRTGRLYDPKAAWSVCFCPAVRALVPRC